MTTRRPVAGAGAADLQPAVADLHILTYGKPRFGESAALACKLRGSFSRGVTGGERGDVCRCCVDIPCRIGLTNDEYRGNCTRPLPRRDGGCLWLGGNRAAAGSATAM